MYVILGATGNTGAVVANKLLHEDKKVRVVGRDVKKLAPLQKLGAEPIVGDLLEPGTLSDAFAGAEAVYWMMPPNMASKDYRAYQDQVTETTASAIESAKIKYVVTLSSIGADKAEKTGPVAGLHAMEERFNRIPDTNILHLRPAYFMENFMPQISIIQNFGMMAGPLRGDLKLPMVATKDIGASAADALLALDFRGKQTRELLGQRDLSYGEAAKIIGSAIGRPALGYVQLPPEQILQAMTGMGMSKNVATLLVEMSDSLNNGYMVPLEPRTPANTTPTTFESFAQDSFAPAFRARAANA